MLSNRPRNPSKWHCIFVVTKKTREVKCFKLDSLGRLKTKFKRSAPRKIGDLLSKKLPSKQFIVKYLPPKFDNNRLPSPTDFQQDQSQKNNENTSINTNSTINENNTNVSNKKGEEIFIDSLLNKFMNFEDFLFFENYDSDDFDSNEDK